MTPHRSDTELARLAIAAAEDAHVSSCEACAGTLEEFRSLVERLRALPDPPQELLETATAYFGRRRALEELIGRLAEDPALRRRSRTDPEGVLRRAGLEPMPELVDALREQGRAGGDLARRIAAKRLWL